jgi:hypothetical protein
MLRLLSILSLTPLSVVAQQIDGPSGPGVPPDVVPWIEGAPYSDQMLVQGKLLRLVIADSVVVGALVQAEENLLALYIRSEEIALSAGYKRSRVPGC